MQVQFRPKERAPDEVGGVKIAYARARGRSHRVAWYLILFGVLSPIALLALGVVGSWLTLTANGSVLLEQYEVRATRAGRLDRLEVATGDLVSAGRTLAVLENPDLDAAAARNGVERRAAAAARGSASEQQRSLTEEVRLRERLVRYQQERRAAIAQLVEAGAATVAELNAADSASTEAEVGLEQARAALARAPAFSTADVEHDLLASEQRSLTVNSPYGGRVLDLLARPGEYVTAGEPLILLARLDEPRVIAYASPKFGSSLRVGMRATIRFPDGARVLASIAEPPRLTQRMPADLVDQFGLRPMTVVLQLLPDVRLTESQRVQGLPVTVRFHYGWESTAIGRAAGAVLGELSR